MGRKSFIICLMLVLGSTLVTTETRSAEFIFRDIPISRTPVFGNSLNIETSLNESFAGIAWSEGDKGYFCFTDGANICGGQYDAANRERLIGFEFVCYDGRSGSGVAERLVGKLGANPLRAEGAFSDGSVFRAEFGIWGEYPHADCR